MGTRSLVCGGARRVPTADTGAGSAVATRGGRAQERLLENVDLALLTDLEYHAAVGAAVVLLLLHVGAWLTGRKEQ